MRDKSVRFSLILAGALVVQLFLQGWFALSSSSAFDEPFFISAGLTLWNTGRDEVLIDQPPMAKRIYGLAAVLAGAKCAPEKRDYMGAWTLYGLNRDHAMAILLYCRAMAIAVGLLLTLAVALWARELAGPAVGAMAACFLALEPNTLAHGSLATADVLLSLVLIMFVRSLWKLFWGTGHILEGGIAGIWAGLAIATKYSAIGYVPAIFLAGLVVRFLVSRKPISIRQPLRVAGLAVAAAGATIYLAFSLHVRFWDPGFGSAGIWSWSPVGLVGEPVNDLMQGVARILAWVNVDSPVFIFGELRSGRIPWYFPAVILLKIQLGLLLAAVASLVFYMLASRTGKKADRWAGLVPVLLPFSCIIALLVVAANSRMHVGVRHVHAVFPLIALMAGGLMGQSLPWPRLRAGIAGLALLWGAVSTARCSPHYLAHFNELAGGPGGGWRKFADSNLDWGQDLPALSRWCADNGIKSIPLEYFGNSDPSWWGVPATPFRDPGSAGFRPGFVAVSVGAIDGVLSHDLTRFAWCRGLKPVARPGWSIHVYDLRNYSR